MGHRMRGLSLPPEWIVIIDSQCCLLALLALLVVIPLASASTSSQASSDSNFDPAASNTAVRFLQTVCDNLYKFGSDAEAFLCRKYQLVLGKRWGFSDVVWGGFWVCVVNGVVLWRMMAVGKKSEKKPETLPRQKKNASDHTLSLWAAWRTKPELEARLSDPGLIQKYSTFKSYTTRKATYPSIRTFYRPHSQADKLPNKPTPLPLLVFVHGLGGCLASFTPILTSLVNIAPCLGIDFPGCGRSAFAPPSWDAYTPDALAELLSVVIEQHLPSREAPGIILIGHSLGSSISLLVAISEQARQRLEVLSLIGICPPAGPPSGKAASEYSRLLKVPTFFFDVLRTIDRRKGLDSPSVTQFTGKDANLELRRTQMKYNRQSRTPVFRRMAWGALPHSTGSEAASSGLPGLDAWSKLKVPIFLIAGDGDTVTKPEEIAKIAQALGKVGSSSISSSNEGSTGQGQHLRHHAGQTRPEVKKPSLISTTEVTVLNDAEGSPDQADHDNRTYLRKRQVLKTSILPYPASHALLYDSSTFRILAGLIQTFLSDHVDTRLSLGWQLQHLSTEGKWDVKNLAKWQAVQPVSEPIAGIFRAMKTLREIDDVHSPATFVEQWRGRIKAVVDISHESPVYDPKGLDDGGIEYHKFPTVSKIPPTADDTTEFINLIDRLLEEPPVSSDGEHNLVGVHCHYGFNRTGFFICCYLIEKKKYGVQAAIDLFAQGRPKGIKHAHFLDQLFVRYCVGLQRAPTM